MENEIRYYLSHIRDAMIGMTNTATGETTVFEPQYIITAVKLPTGAIEVAVNNSHIAEKIDYILDAYDDNMHLKTNTDIVMQNIMIV